MDQDLVIVGGGLAGLVAANRACELGCRATVLEQGDTPGYLCNSRVTGGVVHFATESWIEPPEKLTEKILRITGGFADPAMTAMLAGEGPRALDWFGKQGAKFVQTSPHPRHRWVLGPLRLARPGLDPAGWRGRAGDATLRALTDRLRKRGGTLVLGAKAERLIFEQGQCVGVETTTGVRHAASAVILADGGFQGNDALVGRFISKHPERLVRRNTGTGKGDALRMLEEAGAQLVGMKYFYGHLLARDALRREALWPYPTMDSLATAGIVVDGRGARFADEGLGGIFLANAVAWSDDPLDYWVIFDEEIWNGPAKQEMGFIATNPVLANVKGPIFKADTLEALAAQIGLPAEALTATVAGYNAAVAGKTTEGLTPTRSTRNHAPYAIRRAPFYAVPLCAGLTFTMGGGAVDQDMRVLRPDRSAIAGLFAAGKSLGGLEGGETVGYVGGLSLALITGLRAAEAVARGT